MQFCPKCGTPQSGSRYVPPVNQSPDAWQLNAMAPPVERKSRAGKILLIIGIVLVVLAAGIGTAIYFGVKSYLNTTRSSTAYAMAESTLRSSEPVKERIGEIKNIGIPIGTFKEEDDGTGFAAFIMSVEGERASGQYVVAMNRVNSKWRIETAILNLHSGEEIKVVEKFEDTILNDTQETKTVPNDDPNSNSTNTNNSNTRPKTVSGGVLNGKAISLPQPVYPQVARTARASGTVVVQVTVDEQGNVISASAVSGHPLLRQSAVAAARQARFSPTKLGGVPVKVTGLINYKFVAEP
jgi:TonB family protein